MKDRTTLGQFIASRRNYMNLTQEELAERIGVTKSAVAKWETDGGLPDRDNLMKLAEIINMSVDDLHRIIKGRSADIDSINITSEVIEIFESYGYTVIPPVEQIKNQTQEVENE